MDIHKPKPWHGLREFLKEYVIIVIGVLTALGAEAGVEQLHWRHLAGQHDEDLRNGAQAAAANALHRIAIDGCFTDNLRNVAEALRRPGAAWKGINPNSNGLVRDYLPPALSPQTPAWPYSQWESALADGSLTHFPPERLRAYTAIYRTSQAASEQQRKLIDLLPELTPLAFDQTLTSQDKARYLTIVAQADQIQRLMKSMSRVVLTVAANNDGDWPSAATVTPLIAGARSRMGDCVSAPERSAFLSGGALVTPLLLPRR
jgi:hypothetical protein